MKKDKTDSELKHKLNKKTKEPEPKEATEEQVEEATSNLEPDVNSMGSRG